MLVYKITNKINGKVYVGQTRKTLAQRWRSHIDSVKAGRGNALHSAMRKYGFENFVIEEIEFCDSFDSMNAAEIRWIETLNCLAPNGYNLKTGGSKNISVCDESKKKMSNAVLKRWENPEYRARYVGRKNTPETKEKMRASAFQVHQRPERIAQINSEENLQKLRDHARNVFKYGKQSEDHLAKRVAARNASLDFDKARVIAAENSRKSVAKRIGQKRSEETKRRMSEARRKWWIEHSDCSRVSA